MLLDQEDTYLWEDDDDRYGLLDWPFKLFLIL